MTTRYTVFKYTSILAKNMQAPTIRSRLYNGVQGFTLIEILIVVLLISIYATIFIARDSDSAERKLQRAAEAVKSTLIIVRTEAMRTGDAYGIIANTTTNTIKGYHVDDSIWPPVIEYTVRHPQNKNLLTLQFGVSETLKGISLSNVSISPKPYPSSISNLLGFDASGVPNYYDGYDYGVLNIAALTISAGGISKTISVSPATGRVVIQP